jgi:cytochrome P450
MYIKRLADYGQRRKTWNAGFSSRSLTRYEENIIRRSRELVEALRKRTSAPIDMSKWMDYFVYV